MKHALLISLVGALTACASKPVIYSDTPHVRGGETAPTESSDGSSTGSGGSETTELPAPTVEMPPPTAKGDAEVLFTDIHGKQHTRLEIAGSPIVVTYFSTNCKPCEKQLPILQKASGSMKEDGVIFVGVLIQDSSSDAELSSFLAKTGVTFTVARSTPQILSIFGEADFVPTTIVIDRNATTVKKKVGLMDAKELTKAVTPTL
ncbi:MAG TPA: TlpA disulfide reductase family protein [Kofleriaceae bacterium]|jgi:thiol-disulfide isomerase/thioredoxin